MLAIIASQRYMTQKTEQHIEWEIKQHISWFHHILQGSQSFPRDLIPSSKIALGLW